MKKEFRFPSKDGIHKIHGVKWIPDTKPVAVLQIIHGMVEFIERYEAFAEYMAAKGFVVVGHDHLGHGKSVNQSSEWGYFCKKQSSDTVLCDIHRVTVNMKKEYPDIPYFVMGHSMGSFFARKYACRFSDEITGLIVMGTGQLPYAARKIARLVLAMNTLVYGDTHRSKMIDNIMFGSYNGRIAHPKTHYDWLTKDEKIIDWYVRTPECTFKFTNNGFKTILDTLDDIQNGKNVDKIRKDLPILVVAGEQDPVGAYGAGVKQAYEMYEKADIKDITCKLFKDDRHEILNETDKEQVYAYIYEWLCERIPS